METLEDRWTRQQQTFRVGGDPHRDSKNASRASVSSSRSALTSNGFYCRGGGPWLAALLLTLLGNPGAAPHEIGRMKSRKPALSLFST